MCVVPVRQVQNNLCPEAEVLGRLRRPDEGEEGLAFVLRKVDRGCFGTRHIRFPSTQDIRAKEQVSSYRNLAVASRVTFFCRAVLVLGYPSLNIPGFIVETARQQGIPTMFHYSFWVDRGEGLASYGSDGFTEGRQAARLVDKILKGTKPAEIPVEVISRTGFVINLKVAKALGLTIAPEVLYRADRLVR
jgi:ABC transporter substrate binding protein